MVGASATSLGSRADNYAYVTGRIECVYEPAMTKTFLHGRTEAIRSIQPESVAFTKVG